VETPPPIVWSQKLLGQWDLEVSSFIDTAPPEKQGSLRILHLTFRDEEPTEEELRRYGIKGQEALGVVGSRMLLAKNPAEPKLIKARDVYNGFLEAVPVLEVTDTTFGLVTPQKRAADPYKVLSQGDKRVVIRVTDAEDGEVEQIDCVFDDENTVTITKEGDSKSLVFFRKGVPRPVEARPRAPDLTAEPAARRLLGRWGPAGANYSVEFRPAGAYVIHGAGGDIDGRYQVTAIDGDDLTVRTVMNGMPEMMGDTIQIRFTGGDALSWTNTGTNAVSQYQRIP
jgi:hypothetical protein